MMDGTRLENGSNNQYSESFCVKHHNVSVESLNHFSIRRQDILHKPLNEIVRHSLQFHNSARDGIQENTRDKQNR